MENFRLASQQKLRFETSKGLLSTEQLWDLDIPDLDVLVVSLEEKHNQSAKKSYVIKKSVKDKTAELRFDVALEVLKTKMEDAEKLTQAKEDKEHNAKIFAIIADKDDKTLQGKSKKELLAMIR